MAGNNLQNLSEIFNNSIFRIPDYQRGYSWNERQLIDFWEDLEWLKKDASHYTGLLTIQKVCKEEILNNAEKHHVWQDDLWMFEKGFKAYYVVDGQQRLTTITILLKCILEQFKGDEIINLQKKETLVEKFLYQKLGDYESFIFGYENNDSSDEYFKNKILKRKILKSNEIQETLYTANLQIANDFFVERVQNLSRAELEGLLKKITIQLKFNLYEIDDEFNVFVTFETMNNRGKPLSKLELLKNRLIYLTTVLPDAKNESGILRKYINDVWKTAYEYLGKNKDDILDEDEFLRNHWIMYFGYNKANEPYSDFLFNKHFIVKNIRNIAFDDECHLDNPIEQRKWIGQREIDDYISSISTSIKMWFYLSNPSYSSLDSEIKEYLQKLNRLGFGALKPLVMCAMAKYSEGEIEKEKMLDLLKLAERFIFLVFKVTGRQASTEKPNFYKLPHQLYSGEKTIDDVINHFRWLTSPDNIWNGYDLKKFYNNLEDLFKKGKGYYGWGELRYFLYEYELELEKCSKELHSKIVWEDVQKKDTIEHIYPQTPTEDWKTGFEQFDTEKRNSLLNSPGNLLLLSRSKNSEQQNFSFDYKKKHTNRKGNEVGYFIGSYSEIMVSQYENWTADTILERGMKMLEFMEIRWNLKIENKKELLFLNFME